MFKEYLGFGPHGLTIILNREAFSLRVSTFSITIFISNI